MKLFGLFRKKTDKKTDDRHPEQASSRQNNSSNPAPRDSAPPVGGLFFVPVTKVTRVPMGPHIRLDALGQSSLSYDYVYPLENAGRYFSSGSQIPETALISDGKQFQLCHGFVVAECVHAEDQNGNKLAICFRSIDSLKSAGLGSGNWIAIGTLEDIVKNRDVAGLVIDINTPKQTALPKDIVQKIIHG